MCEGEVGRGGREVGEGALEGAGDPKAEVFSS